MDEATQEGRTNVVLRLDKSRPHSSVHGECLPDDPNYGVKFRQDGLPFDVNGVVIMPNPDHPDKPWMAEDVDGKKVRHMPLYTELMRKTLAAKLERLSRGKVSSDGTVTGEDPEELAKRQEIEECNLAAWLTGEMVYPIDVIFAAVQKRYSLKGLRSKADVVEKLVFDTKEPLVGEDDLDPGLLQAYYNSRKSVA